MMIRWELTNRESWVLFGALAVIIIGSTVYLIRHNAPWTNTSESTKTNLVHGQDEL